MTSSYRHQHVCVTQPTPQDGVRIDVVCFNPGSRRMTFAHVADLIGDLTDPRDAADLLAYGAEIHRLRVHEELRHPH